LGEWTTDIKFKFEAGPSALSPLSPSSYIEKQTAP